MKRLLHFVCLVAVILSMTCCLSACSAFDNYESREVPVTTPDKPYTVKVLVRLKSDQQFDICLFQGDPQSLLYRIEHHAYAADAPRIVNARFLDDLHDRQIYLNRSYLYNLELTLANVPDTQISLTTKPFKLLQKQVTFNPLSLIPTLEENEPFDYFVGLNTTRRFSQANTDIDPLTNDDGSYTYLWQTPDAIVVTNVYPNRPLYYAILVGAVSIIALLIYFYCRRAQQPPLALTVFDTNNTPTTTTQD